MERHHGSLEHRGLNEAATTRSGRVRSHRFANRFAHLDPYVRDDAFLDALGEYEVDGDELVGPMLGEPGARADADVPSGVAFFGQFVDHEITFDPTSALERRNDPEALRNFRTPALDLDSMYGAGSEVRPFLYDDDDPHEAKLLTGPAAGASPADESATRAARFGATDLQRNGQGSALIVDPRNDENLVISQLLLTFLKFHNRVVDYVRSGDGHDLIEDEEDAFGAAQRLVRWHYQWLVLHEFLPRVCDNTVLDDVRAHGRRFFLDPDDPVAIPVEFAVAAYRYGHSQIRDAYTVNRDSGDVQFFPGPAPEKTLKMAAGTEGPDLPPGVMEAETDDHLDGFRPVPDRLVVEWPYFFDHGAETDESPQPAARIDAELPPALHLLPFVDEEPASLAARNLRRGKALGLPSGQALARAMDVDPLSNDDLPLGSGRSFGDYLTDVHRGADTEAPAWLYVLAEADRQNDGHRLGAVGSRIVGEVIRGLVDADERPFVDETPDWRPVLPRAVTEVPDDEPERAAPYRFGDLLRFATGPAPDGLTIHEVDADGTGSAPDTPAGDPTNGEAVILEHAGSGDLPVDGYVVDFEEQTGTITGEGLEPLPDLRPGERLVVYTGEGPEGDPGVRTVAFDRDAAAIDDDGETVTVRTPTGEVSAFAEG
ncbi:peroxidase family protein [Haloplanus halophilus]|uniref:peroxidase family protein n=1 Tax=Haloplanus halophilus TaxID=2949993 RepID=UPI0020413139|nr:peroxidase family protein [Haloplanus sp. GDY1]